MWSDSGILDVVLAGLEELEPSRVEVAQTIRSGEYSTDYWEGFTAGILACDRFCRTLRDGQ